ncbi:hypothetical protein EJ08DRAFT_712272 [Tothia fuscella]|uniref:Uncharacterized protein n=1 Tax=Tothia fuscella TaxID=1048955 RepID=A0A9P4TYY2_9PEZI|nr:hypothetical protein EJ08DRAFT_712272 [Tothia fuscella]
MAKERRVGALEAMQREAAEAAAKLEEEAECKLSMAIEETKKTKQTLQHITHLQESQKLQFDEDIARFQAHSASLEQQLEHSQETQRQFSWNALQENMKFADNYPGYDERRTKSELIVVEDAIQRWATWAAVPSLASTPIEELARLEPYLSGMMHSPSGTLHTGLKTEDMDEDAPRMVLTACVTKFVYERILGNPFWFMDRLMGSPSADGSDNLSAQLRVLLNQLLQTHGENAEKVHIWRSSLLRILNPAPAMAEYAPSGELLQRMQDAMRAAQLDVVDEAIKTFSILMKEPNSSKGREALRTALLNRTEQWSLGDVSMNQWCHRHYFKLSYISDLPTNFDRDQMLPDKLHRPFLRQDPARLDGQQVQMILAPGIVRVGKTYVGSTRSSTYTTSILWKRAIAWMGESFGYKNA